MATSRGIALPSLLLAAGALGASAMLPAGSTAAQTAAPQPPPRAVWDWTGIIGTGQSLSVGARAPHILSTTQPYNNLKLSTGDLPWPVSPSDPALAVVPLVEPVGRLAPTYPSAWPENIDGETFHTSMADEITALARAGLGRDLVTVHSAVGEDGQGMLFIQKHPEHKGVNGRSYAAALIVTKAIARLAKAAGKSYGVGAVVVTHGETDAGNPDYEAQLYRLWQDYNADLSAITGQTQPVAMIVSQQNSVGYHSPSTQAQWRIGVDHPAEIVCSGPKYQYPYYEDGVHLTGDGYRELGEKYGQVYYQRVVLGTAWEPLAPVAARRDGATITVQFHVPVPPLVWDAALEPPHPSVPEWRQGKGFEVTSATGAKVTITSAAITGDTVTITCAADPGPGAQVGYAMVGEPDRMSAPYGGTRHWGLLRDSDPFRGSVTGEPQPNYAVAFDMTLP